MPVALGDNGSRLKADAVKRERTANENNYGEVTFDVENGYDDAITDAGFGMVYRHPESEEIVGGWYKRSVADDSVPDGVGAEYPAGESTHTVGIRGTPAAGEAENIEIYMWP